MNQLSWDVITAIGTILSAIIALGIAVFSYTQSLRREKKSREKEAIEKILTSTRKEIHDLLIYKWDCFNSRNRWHRLKDKRLDFPLQYYWLPKDITQSLEDFDQQFSRFDHLSQQIGVDFTKLITGVFRQFISNKGISYETTGDGALTDEGIIHSHWSCVIGGKYGPAVTLYSLVMWGTSLSGYIEERRNDPELPNKNIDSISFSVHSSSANIKLTLTLQQSDELLAKIEEEIKKYPNIMEYRKKWQELYNSGSYLIKEVDLWLSSE